MRIALLGDMAFFGKMSIVGNQKIAEYFSEIADYLEKFDYVVGNLETPFSVKKKPHGAKSAYICADVSNVKSLKQLHVNAVCLANNHMFDFGAEGYETTKKVLKENEIEFFGTEGKELLIEQNGNRISFTGFCCYSSNPLRCVRNGEYGVNEYNVANVKNILQENKQKGYLSIVAVHAGLEHVNYPSIKHVRAARLLAETDDFIYYGHHPHVIQGIEEYHGSLLAHSLGNFCFDDVYIDKSSTPLIELTENNRTGIVLELTIDDNKIKEWREQPIYISKDNGIQLTNSYDEINDYNKALIECEDNEKQYEEKRNSILSDRASSRKSKRDIKWYLKRFRPRYLFIMLNARNNKKKYNNCIIKNIEQK